MKVLFTEQFKCSISAKTVINIINLLENNTAHRHREI